MGRWTGIKRDLFLQLAMKDELTKAMQQTNDASIIAKCEESMQKLKDGIEQSGEKLFKSMNEVGKLESSTYDDITIYLEKKNKSMTGIDIEMEKKIAEVENDLLRQVNENIYKDPNDRSIEITEPILNVYEANLTLVEIQQEISMDRLIIEDDTLVIEDDRLDINSDDECKIDFDDGFKIEFPDDSIDWGSIEVKKPIILKNDLTR